MGLLRHFADPYIYPHRRENGKTIREGYFRPPVTSFSSFFGALSTPKLKSARPSWFSRFPIFPIRRDTSKHRHHLPWFSFRPASPCRSSILLSPLLPQSPVLWRSDQEGIYYRAVKSNSKSLWGYIQRLRRTVRLCDNLILDMSFVKRVANLSSQPDSVETPLSLSTSFAQMIGLIDGQCDGSHVRDVSRNDFITGRA